MQPHFTQQPHDPDLEQEPRPRFPVSAMLWIPLALLFGAGMVAAGKFGHDRATAELNASPNPKSGNEAILAEIIIDPGGDPMVLAFDRKSLEEQPDLPPGSEGSRTFVISNLIRAKVIERDGKLALIQIGAGKLKGQRLWIRESRLPHEAKP